MDFSLRQKFPNKMTDVRLRDSLDTVAPICSRELLRST